MRLSLISRVIKEEVVVIALYIRVSLAYKAKRDRDNSQHHAKTEFNNYFFVHMDYYKNNDLMATKQQENRLFLVSQVFWRENK